jgi:hypothetical protein
LNLIMNGVEAGPRSVLISVEDTGAGLDPAVAQRIFEPFFTTKSEGLGIGISICRSIVEGHRGRLWAAPRASNGVATRFALPIDSGQLRRGPPALLVRAYKLGCIIHRTGRVDVMAAHHARRKRNQLSVQSPVDGSSIALRSQLVIASPANGFSR